ncbi:alkylhydroperoxidase AhpD family core domain-containing protein [Rhizobiales bacterium GAS191]|jgi:AhpD family alkylhydroperoxidase|nr:alkylhydroperoxidase AhpD family core domain-containing protein [Rhizobiales bacterium GAS113]SEE22265.1 alkylhydroperoxidase AhpD family core domain-containing protein [Rhizobiales bacterium GAS191]SEE33954.1 alkylhydroperoxidase AhpD family core domain-containing protein [Rhizobiales bacterium GAS188]
MTDYQHHADLELVPAFVGLAPQEAKAFLAFNHAVGRQDGEVPPKYRELISLAVALTTQCAYCIDVHSRAAVAAGVTREELAETALIAAAVRAGGTLGHALFALRPFDEVAAEAK